MNPIIEKLSQYESGEEFERYLGDPLDPARQFSFQRVVEEDEQEVFPEGACAEVENWGLHQYYVPEQYGGRFRSFEELFGLLRLHARRNATSAMAHIMSYVAAMGIWSTGGKQQKKRVAEMLLNRNRMALAVTERDHGGDLLANEVTATKVDGGYLLQGEKWLINNATRSAALALFARTEPAGGPRGFSLFFIEKRLLDPSSFIHLPKVKTLGMRGADVSGIRFERCLVPDSALVGTPGAALETSLKAFQISRTILPAAALGMADTALRSAMRFALSRRLYGASVFEIPEARRVLVEAFIDILICDCVAISAARSLHVAADQMSLWSAITKYFVPARVERLIAELSVVMGARHFLRQDHDSGVFQKIWRESSAPGVIHLGGHLNLNLIGQQLRSWADDGRGRQKRRRQEADIERTLNSIFSLAAPLPDFDPQTLDLFNRRQDLITQGAELCGVRIAAAGLDGETADILSAFAGTLVSEFGRQAEALANLDQLYGAVFTHPPELWALARRHCLLHAGASCLWMWLFNRESLGEFFSRGEWLVLALDRLMAALAPPRGAIPSAFTDRVANELLRLHREDRLFSIIPLKLAGIESTSA